MLFTEDEKLRRRLLPNVREFYSGNAQHYRAKMKLRPCIQYRTFSSLQPLTVYVF